MQTNKSTTRVAFLVLLAFVLVLVKPGMIRAQVIATIAGNGIQGYSGDGGPALSAELNTPLGVCLDPSGNLFISDYSNNNIRKVDAATGIISTIAGTGVVGFSGDGGPAINATFNAPSFIRCDKAGNLFIVDYWNYSIRKIDAKTGIITTIAGDGTDQYHSGQAAANHGLLPRNFAFDAAGNMYITQHLYIYLTNTTNIISKLDMATGIITTYAGTGVMGFSGDGGPALNAQFSDPFGISLDKNDNVYVVDGLNGRVRRIDKTSSIITTVAGDGTFNYPSLTGPNPALKVGFKSLHDLFIDINGDILITDQSDERIFKLNPTAGTITTISGNQNFGKGAECVNPTQTIMGNPVQVVADNSGNIFVTDQSNYRIRKIFTPASTSISVFISADANNVCAGTAIHFTATASNTGSPLVYQWLVNGVTSGTNSASFSSTTLSNNDVVSCTVQNAAGANCSVSAQATSNKLTVAVVSALNPGIQINASANPACAGSSVSFTANASQAGSQPSYQWMVNGIHVGTNSPLFSSSSLLNNDKVTCTLTTDPSFTCVLANTVTSNTIIQQITAPVAPTVSISTASGPLQVCNGDSLTISAQTTGAGTAPSFEWFINNAPAGTGAAITVKGLQSSETVYCQLTPGGAGCYTPAAVTSNQLQLTVTPPPVLTPGFADSTIQPGKQVQLLISSNNTLSSYQWTPVSALVDPQSLQPTTQPLFQSTVFTLTAKSGSCTVVETIHIKVLVPGLYLPTAFTPNGDGLNDIFRLPPNTAVSLNEFSVFNRWGIKIFTTKNTGTGWDGTIGGKPCAPGTYIYRVSGKNGSQTILIKGTVVLIR